MKAIFTFFFVSACLFLNSCTQNLDNQGDLGVKIISSYDANLKALSYLKLEGEYYVFNLSMSEAKELGISESDYIRMKKEVEEGNALIAEFKKEFPEAEFNFVDPQYMEVDELKTSPLLKSRSESGSGTFSVSLQPYDQNMVSTSKYIPRGIGTLNVACVSVGFFQVFNYSVTTLGEIVAGGGTGLAGTYNGTITPAASGTVGTFSFKTSNTNGGTCRFYKE